MFDAEGGPRPHYRTLYEQVQTSSRTDFDERCTTRDRVFRDRGITFAYLGEERPFPLDLVPRVVVRGGVGRRSSWECASACSRSSASSRTCTDRARSCATVSCRAGSSSRRRTSTARSPASSRRAGVRVHVAGIDLVRDGDRPAVRARGQPAHAVGHLVRRREPAGDDARVPRALRVAPRPPRVRLPDPLARRVRATAPRPHDDPNVVVFTPGVHNAAYFEHSFLARQMGVELVEGRDLVCHDNVVYMRTTAGEERVARHLPAHRRRVPRPAALPPRLADRLRRAS